MAHIEEPQKQHHNDVWFLDSECNNHMCGKLSLFSEMIEGINKTVRLGNHSKMKVVGAWNIWISIERVSHLVQDVLYVPDLKKKSTRHWTTSEKGVGDHNKIQRMSSFIRPHHSKQDDIKYNVCTTFEEWKQSGDDVSSNWRSIKIYVLASKVWPP